MIKFERYPHINDLLNFYLLETPDHEISRIFEQGIKTTNEAELFSQFIWIVVNKIHDDEETGRLVLDRADNTDMLPDLSYEITKYMRAVGFYSVWEQSSGI